MRLPLLLVALATVLAAGCDGFQRPGLFRDYGAPYRVRPGVEVRLPGEAAERPTPAVSAAGDLWLVVAYQGGCVDHTWRTQWDGLSNGGSVVWLQHVGVNDPCAGVVEDTIRVPLAAALRPGGATPALLLATPDGDELSLARPGIGG